MITIYLGYNSFKTHKRGVENVIDFQSMGSITSKIIYIHWDDVNIIERYNNFITIGIKKDFFWIFRLNYLMIFLKKKYKIVLIHSHNPLMSLFLFFKTTLFTVHDALYYLTKARGYKINFLFYFLEKFLYQRVKFVHFISEYAKKQSLFKGENYRIIYNSSHFEKVIPKSLIQSSFIRFNINTIDILIVRSIEERARIDLIIKIAETHTKNNYRFLISGKGPLLNFFKNYLLENNITNVIFLGYTKDSDLLNLYNNVKLIIVPAQYGEGFGLPIIEGYLFNKPVIASNVCAIPEIIISEKYLFTNDVADINDKIDFALNYTQFNFKEFYESKFSNYKICHEFKNLYLDLIKWKYI